MKLEEVFEELHASGLACEPSPACIVLPVFRLRDVIWKGDKEIASKYGLTWADFKTLSALRHAPKEGHKPSDLYERLSITSGGLTKVLKKLEGQELIQMACNESDGRSRFALLTRKGRKLVERVIKHFERVNHGTFGKALTNSEQAQLSALLLKLLNGLEDG